MFIIFTQLADYVVYSLIGLSKESHLAKSLHFFVEDTTKIFVLLFILIYVISFLRASLDTEKVRKYLEGKHRVFGYSAAAMFGAITPFCSCSSIPLFLGFTTARIPIGTTMAFLITSPMINEVAIALLGGMLGLKFTVMYVVTGVTCGIIGGFFFDLIKAEKYLTPLVNDINSAAEEERELSELQTEIDIEVEIEEEVVKLSMKERHKFAKEEMFTILSRIWKWILIGVGAGAALHGFVPESFITDTLGSGQWWSVPGAVLLGIPLYANASGIIPVADSLLQKGLPVGTTLAFMMSTVAASFPEFMMLKQVMKTRLLVIFFFLLLVLFTITGWIFNSVNF